MTGSRKQHIRKLYRRKVPLSVIFGTKLNKKERNKKWKILQQHQKTKRMLGQIMLRQTKKKRKKRNTRRKKTT